MWLNYCFVYVENTLRRYKHKGEREKERERQQEYAQDDITLLAKVRSASFYAQIV